MDQRGRHARIEVTEELPLMAFGVPVPAQLRNGHRFGFKLPRSGHAAFSIPGGSGRSARARAQDKPETVKVGLGSVGVGGRTAPGPWQLRALPHSAVSRLQHRISSSLHTQTPHAQPRGQVRSGRTSRTPRYLVD